jgi:beta-galactosidase
MCGLGGFPPSERDVLLPTSSPSLSSRPAYRVHTALIFSIFIGVSLGLLVAVHQDPSSSSEWITAVDRGKKSNTLLKRSDTRSSGSIIRPGSIFHDTDGNPINAHGGGFLYHNNIYYWYGEIKNGATYLPKANADWFGTRVDLVGISCYSSTDLIRWKYLGNVLPAVTNDTLHDLYITAVAERPKVVYNSFTNKFVMWLHIDSMDYKKARSGVATSDSPDGPFTYIQSFRPNDQMARDLTVFVDSNNNNNNSNQSTTTVAYLITSSEDNAVMHIHELSSNYTSFTGRWKRIFQDRYMEAPTLFQREGKYYFIGSGCTAWKPNAARSAVSSSIWGPWTELGNPCKGNDANTTFHSQSTYVLPINTNGRGGSSGDERFMFAADRWNETNLSDSRYVWLPIEFDTDENSGESSPIIQWQDEWDVFNA